MGHFSVEIMCLPGQLSVEINTVVALWKEEHFEAAELFARNGVKENKMLSTQ